MSGAACTCGHGDLAAHFHMTPCQIKVNHLIRVLDRPECDQHDWIVMGEPDDEWRECVECGAEDPW